MPNSASNVVSLSLSVGMFISYKTLLAGFRFPRTPLERLSGTCRAMCRGGCEHHRNANVAGIEFGCDLSISVLVRPITVGPVTVSDNAIALVETFGRVLRHLSPHIDTDPHCALGNPLCVFASADPIAHVIGDIEVTDCATTGGET